MGIEEDAARVASDTLGKVAGDIYGDIARPAARQVGTALETVFKVGLSPIAMLDWGFERSKEWLTQKVTERIREIPQEMRQAPPMHIAVPTIQAIAMAADAPELRDLYAELLLKAIDVRTFASVHPSFINLIGQLSPQEALVLQSLQELKGATLFSDQYPYCDVSIPQQFRKHCESLGLPGEVAQLWLENFQRLRLVELSSSVELVEREADKERPRRMENIESRSLELTEYGKSFLEACTPPGLLAAEE